MIAAPVLNRITIYPVKSLDGMPLQKAMISEGGCLLHDREYVITDEEGNIVRGKSNPLIYRLRSSVDFEKQIISFREQGTARWNPFHLQNEIPRIHSYLSGYFGMHVTLKQDTTGRFMDVPDIGGATLLSTASLQSVLKWYPGLQLDEGRKRFRATLELDGVEAFWEDHLFSSPGKGIEFKIGDVTLVGIGPRERCHVPSRNPDTGEILHAFPKIFTQHRDSTMPAWSTLNEYGHHYFLAVDCYIPPTETGKWIEVGNPVAVIGETSFSGAAMI